MNTHNIFIEIIRNIILENFKIKYPQIFLLKAPITTADDNLKYIGYFSQEKKALCFI